MIFKDHELFPHEFWIVLNLKIRKVKNYLGLLGQHRVL